MASLDLSRPFRRRDARAAGMTDRQLARQIRLGRDLYVGRGVPLTPELRARAVLMHAPPGAVVSDRTAAAIWGGVVPGSSRVHLILPSGRMRRPGVIGRTAAAHDVRQVRGLTLTSPAATFCDLGRELGLVDLVVLGDSLVRAQVVTVQQLRQAAANLPPRARHTAGVRRAVDLVRAGVDSPMETRLRLLIVLAGLPEPVVNHVEYREDGSWDRRFDLSYPQVKLAIEYDGRQHAKSVRQWEHDVARRERLDQDGWRLVVVLARDIYHSPAQTLERVRRAMLDVGLRPPTLRDDWRMPFAG